MMAYKGNMIVNWKHIIVNAALMLVAIAGMVIVARGAPFGQRIVLLTMLCSLGYTAFVRAKQVGYRLPLDERELATAGGGIGLGGVVSCALVSLWCFMIVLTDKGIWYPDAEVEWQALGYFLLGLMVQVKNLAVALMTPPYAAELLDED